MTANNSNLWIKFPDYDSKPFLRLFCFPYAGAGASVYKKWHNFKSPGLEICPIQLPGRENRFAEASYIRMPSLLNELAIAIYPYLNIPFAFFGYSMGALLSFELTRLLRKKKYPCPVHLFVASRRAPQIQNHLPSLHLLTDQELIEKVRIGNGTLESNLDSTKWIKYFLPILRKDLELCETYSYKYEQPLSCPISVFGGRKDVFINDHELSAWNEQTYNTFSMQMFPGDHFFLHKSGNSLLKSILLRSIIDSS